MRVIAGDIGGTHTALRLLEVGVEPERVLAEERYHSPAFEGLGALLTDFLRRHRTAPPTAACFGVAGPVRGTGARTTNLPWSIDAEALAVQFGIEAVRLINDFQAVGYGIEGLGEADVVTLQAGREEAHGPRVAIGAGTGLGEALMVWAEGHYEALPSEGGHVDFAPTDALQVDLLRYLMGRHPRVTYERVVSGPGLVSIYEFLREGAGGGAPGSAGPGPGGLSPATVSELGMSGRDPVAVQALELFARAYGAQAGNLALTCLATGGVYVAGGIAPKIIAKLRDGTFVQAFRDKGRMRPLLEAMPVRVVTNRRVGLLGATAVARRLALGH